ncbi:MAG: hypothetical protein WD795_03585 [Woeseia sp.]
MQTSVGIYVILAILAVSLEGPADFDIFGDPGGGASAQLQNDQADAPAGESIGNGDDNCTACTPSCYCGCHGGVAIANLAHFEQAPPDTHTPQVETRYLSLTNPPSLPPPIPHSLLA